MDFDNIVNDRYYCFGSLFVNDDGTINYRRLRKELNVVNNYLAFMEFEANDLEYSIWLPPSKPSGWKFAYYNEHDDELPGSEEDFKAIINTEQFKKFANEIPKKIQKAFGALNMVDDSELSKNGIKKDEINDLLMKSLRIMTIVKGETKYPKLKGEN